MIFLLAAALAQDVRVVPWNGAKGAVSFTFDDGDPSQLDVAVPELNARKLRGTFFLITSKIDRAGDWKKAVAAGHEIASHSATHRNPGQLKPGEEEAEVVGAAATLEKAFGLPVRSFAYPFSALSEGLRSRVTATHMVARGGAGELLDPTSTPDWINLPSQVTLTETKPDVYLGWIDRAESEGRWSIFMIHGLEGTPWGYSPILRKSFTDTLDRTKGKDLWVAPFGEIGAYWRAQKIVEKAKIAGNVWTWEVPKGFPKGIQLKMKAAAGVDLLQEGKPLKDGLLRFDLGTLALKRRP